MSASQHALKLTGTGGVRPGRAGTKTQAGIWDVIQWAFQRERAGIDFEDDLGGGPCAIGMEYRLMEAKRLGCFVDGGGTSPCHPDADLVAAALAVLPDAFGGRRMALWIVELARAGQVPDWMAGARPRIEPVEWRRCRYGLRAKVASAGKIAYMHRGRRREADLSYCPILYAVTEAEVRSARRAYSAWWSALLALQINLRSGFGLSGFEVTRDMPDPRPWEKGD